MYSILNKTKASDACFSCKNATEQYFGAIHMLCVGRWCITRTASHSNAGILLPSFHVPITLTLLRIVLKWPLPTNLSLLILNQAVIVRFNNYKYTRNKTVLFGNISTVTVIVLTILFRKSKHCSFLYNFHRVLCDILQ